MFTNDRVHHHHNASCIIATTLTINPHPELYGPAIEFWWKLLTSCSVNHVCVSVVSNVWNTGDILVRNLVVCIRVSRRLQNQYRFELHHLSASKKDCIGAKRTKVESDDGIHSGTP